MARDVSNAPTNAPTQEDLVKQIATLKADLLSITETVGEMTKAQGKELSTSAKEHLETVRDRSAEQIADVNARAVQLGHQAGDHVRNQPMLTLGLAVGLGFLVGLSASSRR